MTAEQRMQVRADARRYAVESRRAQGLPEVITDQDALRKIAAIFRPALTRPVVAAPERRCA